MTSAVKKLIVREFKGGLTMYELAVKYSVVIEKIADVIRRELIRQKAAKFLQR